MRIERLSDAAVITTVNEVCDGIKTFIKNNPDSAKGLLIAMRDNFLDPLAQDDFWGTEGWLHAFGIE